MKLRRRTVTRPLSIAVGGVGHRTSTRTSILVEIEHEGRIGRGEASPLPGYSLDTLEDATQAIDAFDAFDLDRIHDVTRTLPPSARFAIETALLDLRAQRSEKPLWALFRETTRPLRLSASLIGPDDRVVDEARVLVGLGFTTLKRKVDATSLHALQAVRARFPGVELRADANRSLSHADIDADLIEEPTHAPFPTRPNLALDESLAAWTEDEALALLSARRHEASAIVVKPARDGLFGALALASQGLPAIVTHMWDGSIGHRAALHVAFAIDGELAHGLASHPGIDERYPPIVAPFTEPGL